LTATRRAEPPNMNRTRADVLLLIVALIWGTTFVAQKSANAHVGPILFVALRFLAATVFLLPLAVWEARRSAAPLRRADWIAAGIIGSCLCAGCWFQQIGLETTTATNAGFLTAVYMVVVPFVAWGFSGRPPRPLVLVAGVIAVAGAWLLGGGGSGATWSRGDIIILAGDLVWAAHITLVGHHQGVAARPVLLSLVQCLITALASLPAALVWQPASLSALGAALPAIAYAGIVSSGFAFTMQIVAQRHTPAAEAALIMSLESVFAAVAGAMLLHEMLSVPAAIGAGLILTGVVLVESNALFQGTATGLRSRLAALAVRNRS
jgi:drug/metabolite transporter (DMT)-like permease